ncbi:uncharacterized protein FOMMEDRAFT_108695 [Fomitiporia mediterranea MF3/22]|uniref:uncharacterized protein n=1 Tax=Fomitiporia mediterranea (strain MF3/22) TaxID=694068 RepID=UPI0004407A34|nr:uncharacterized protein FOMMEDRAFT_108695 [Fomitiporia mediterranea MF3/22]EJD03460.1 hypothetical protein FOMMEDRAFT_108695 [Fomitiporia mediterranea MF3/22]
MSNIEISQGLLHLPGSNHETKALVQKLLEEDLKKHHCFYGKPGFHNHLPHHLLALYDLGAPAKVMQDMYNLEAEVQSPINLVDRKNETVAQLDLTITKENWTEHLGREEYYIAYLEFFKTEVQKGVPECLEEYIFSPKANGNENCMLLRIVGGAAHPLIQIGYGVEFNMPVIAASGLAEVAVTKPIPPALYDDTPGSSAKNATVLSIIKQMYDSEILVPVMPYQPEAFISARMKDATSNGRPEEICRLSSQIPIEENPNVSDLDSRVKELIWAATLLLASTGKHERKPRLDFFLMHLLTSSHFLPTLIHAVKTPINATRLLRIYVSVLLFLTLLRGRPRIDPTLIMTYPDTPRPPNSKGNPADVNPWPAIIDEVIHAPDSHTVKTIRSLYYAAQHYGETPPGGAIGAFDDTGKEILRGAGKLDGTIFVRAAGIVMNNMGWLTHGQEEGKWDRSALGWDDAWNTPD